eukprot:CAMPEP_0174379180 /NCGR_PEP_ID=MMETSP0811_2-20130205/122540_1 /TAXON_ID=73025 ORGANISM="Eutreptiella gymnastica-like, Strain CCMP1594" /NCGR_SAMPLE_ID=MMETSP0811_2 /ASSEMBLY_ACC=CAM_ASM_000667 /LENGTH=54 /DNA_ID=CAMNT_0015531633 /DNA_START=1141 /DNA_END=1302 /DNA_ORIENTATION=+
MSVGDAVNNRTRPSSPYVLPALAPLHRDPRTGARAADQSPGPQRPTRHATSVRQ